MSVFQNNFFKKMEKKVTSRNLLEEAIADAKAVRESAIENAKLSLQEAFEPKLRSMIASQLEEMEKEEMYEEAEEEVMEAAFEDEVEMDEEEMDLDEILAELENEMDEEDMKSEEMELYEEETETEMEDETMEYEEEMEIEDMTEEELKSFIESVIEDMIKAGELEAGEEFEGEEEVEMEDEEELDEELDLNELVYELKKEKKTIQMEKELEEAYSTIETLKSELNEINLLNAKLLYTNKIFKSKNLTESQKIKVLGAFDKATSVKEAKLVFETLITDSNVGNKSKSKPVMESLIGGASKSIGAPKMEKQTIMESNEMVKRFQKLAGII
jgi:hypothetical protein